MVEWTRQGMSRQGGGHLKGQRPEQGSNDFETLSHPVGVESWDHLNLSKQFISIRAFLIPNFWVEEEAWGCLSHSLFTHMFDVMWTQLEPVADKG